MPIAIALLIALLLQSIDEVAGAWRGTVMHEGETREVIVEFVRKGEKVLALFSSPSIHAWRFPYAFAERSGNRITAGGMVFELDPSAGTLTTTLAADLVPKYSLRVTLHRIDAVVPAERPPIDAPAREPRWTLDLHAPIWADLAVDGDTVFAGAEDGRMHAIDATTGRELWTFTAGGALRARPAFLGGDVIVQADDGVLSRIDGRTGTEKWHVAIAKARTRFGMGDPASRYENFASGVEVDGRSGRAIWSTDVQGSAWGRPAVTSSTVYEGVTGVLHYIAPHRGALVAIDRASGRIAWWYSAKPPDPAPASVTPYGFAGSVAVGRRFVYAGGLDGVLYAFEK